MNLRDTEIAIIAPTADEYLGVVEQMSHRTKMDEFPRPMTIGTIGTHSVLCCQSGKGQERTATATTLVLDRARPSIVLLVGIAGGFSSRKVHRGDVIVAHTIHSFDYGKLTAGKFNRRPELDINCDEGLLARAALAVAEKNQEWKNDVQEDRPDEKPSSEFEIHVDCYVASSDKVVDDPSHAFYAKVAKAFAEIHAVEMEGIGAGAAARLVATERAARFLMIRGISDESAAASGKPKPASDKRKPASDKPKPASDGTEQRKAWKKYAIATAAAFTRALIEQLPSKQMPDNLQIKLVSEMNETAELLYLECQRYWREREGGSKHELREQLYKQYKESRVVGKDLETRLKAFFASDVPRQKWHAVMDLLTVRYYQLIGRAGPRLLTANAGPEHSGLSVEELSKPKEVLAAYHAALKAATEAVLGEPPRFVGY